MLPKLLLLGSKAALHLGAWKYKAHIEMCVVTDHPTTRALLG